MASLFDSFYSCQISDKTYIVMQIKKILEVAEKYGFKIYEIFDKDELIEVPLINFEGNEYDLMNLFELLQLKGFPVSQAVRVYRKEPLSPLYGEDPGLGDIWKEPFNRITFYS